MRTHFLAAVLVSAVVASSAGAQGILVVSQNKCALDKQDQMHRNTDSLWLPIAQELVTEGKLIAAGSAYHAWGDEWNVLLWYNAASITAFLGAFNELARRFNQRHPGALSQWLGNCTEHKDSFYSLGKSTTAPPAPTKP